MFGLSESEGKGEEAGDANYLFPCLVEIWKVSEGKWGILSVPPFQISIFYSLPNNKRKGGGTRHLKF